MKLKHVNPHNVEHLVPSWIASPHSVAKWLDAAFDQAFEVAQELRPQRWDKRVAFWVEIDFNADPLGVRVCIPEAEDDLQKVGQLFLMVGDTSVVLPVNAMLKGSDDLKGMHCVYVHTIFTETPLSYVGVTKQRWFARLAQHRCAAGSGSKLVFHSALRDHASLPIQHRVVFSGIDFESAMELEEEFVDAVSLYPKGMNMIPGGFAGLRYLASIGVHARTAVERDNELERIANIETIEGKPNPLCAARWAGDQDFVNRVICGHSGRLTVEQVRQIKMLVSFGKPASDVAAITGAPQHKVKSVAVGKTYGRVA